MSTAVRQQLQAIRDEHGSLTPELVVDAARDARHPLHAHFDWDDSVAGEKWRLAQAGQLLRVTYRPIPGKPTDLRAFTAVKAEGALRSEYVPTEDVLADPFQRQILLRQLDREWKAFKRRYADVAEFADLIISDLTDKAS